MDLFHVSFDIINFKSQSVSIKQITSYRFKPIFSTKPYRIRSFLRGDVRVMLYITMYFLWFCNDVSLSRFISQDVSYLIIIYCMLWSPAGGFQNETCLIPSVPGSVRNPLHIPNKSDIILVPRI